VTLSHTYDLVDYVSLHQYFDNEDGDTADFLAKSLETDRFIRTVTAVCDYVKAKKRSRKDLMLSFDEWNLWYHSKREDDESMKNAPWRVAPRLLEDVYSFEDALVAGCMLITFLRHADRVKMACMAQLVNVIAPIMAEEEGVCRQTTFYPFLHVSRFGRGSSLQVLSSSPRYDSRSFCDVPYLESAVTLDEESGTLTLFAVNRSLTESLVTDFFVRGCEDYVLQEHIVLESEDLQAVNTVKKPDRVTPSRRSGSVTALGAGHFEIDLHKASWNVLRFARR
jgi:alpha-N-arabinofuranosidase